MSYVLRYFFDPGSGICLWAKNGAAKEKFGYPVEHFELPLSENAKRFLQHLVAWFDTSIDWSAPGDSNNHWSAEELLAFRAASTKGLLMLKDELSGQGYEFVDETAP